MAAVMQNFVYYRYFDLALCLVGGSLLIGAARGDYRQGVGAGLLAQAALMLLLDYFAETRGRDYLALLRELIASAP